MQNQWSLLISWHCSPWPKALIPAMLSKPRVGTADSFKASGPDWLKCVRGERIQKGRGGSHIFSRLSRALHSLGRLPVRELSLIYLVVRQNGAKSEAEQ